MGFLARLMGSERPTPVDVTVTGSERVSVVGESHYQAALGKACGAGESGDVDFDCTAELVPEPDNAYDPNAIMVCIDGDCIGYLSREDAVRFGPTVRAMIEAGHPTLCSAWIGRQAGSGNPNMGVVVELPVEA